MKEKTIEEKYKESQSRVYYLEHKIKGLQDSLHQQKIAKASLEQSIESVLSCLELKDSYTLGHSQRVQKFSQLLADRISKNQNIHIDLTHLQTGSLYHDIGKICVYDFILKRRGQLSASEIAYIRRVHTDAGSNVMSSFSGGEIVSQIVQYHHSPYHEIYSNDYWQLQDIKDMIYIVTIADCFDGITSERPYHPGKSVSQGKQILKKEQEDSKKKKKYNPLFLDEFLEIPDEELQNIMNEFKPKYMSESFKVTDGYKIVSEKAVTLKEPGDDIKKEEIRYSSFMNYNDEEFFAIESFYDHSVDASRSTYLFKKDEWDSFLGLINKTNQS